MNLGFYYHVPAVEKDGAIFMPGYQGCFIDNLAKKCEKVVCFLHSPNPSEMGLMDYRIQEENVEWVDLSLRGSTMGRTLRSGKFTSVFKQRSGNLDVLLIRGPTPLLPALAGAASIPTALLLVGDYTSGVDDLPQPIWRKELIRIWAHWNKSAQTRIAKRSLTFVNSHKLYEELQGRVPILVETRTTTLSDDTFYERLDTCQNRPYKLLFVGRMDRSKGLLEMVRALAMLTQGGEDITLDLVGWPEEGDPVLDDLQSLAKELGVGERVKYLGSRALGPDLFACYRSADIFVIASMAAEGFPRTIWEAMANSIPVVATKVGSIPAFIEGAAELVEPRETVELASAIRRLLHTPDLRQKYIRNGMDLARKNTLEIQAEVMIKSIENWLEEIA